MNGRYASSRASIDQGFNQYVFLGIDGEAGLYEYGAGQEAREPYGGYKPMLRPLPCFWLASCSRFIACLSRFLCASGSSRMWA